MSDRRLPIDPAHARELLRRERERIESSLIDSEKVREGELEAVERAEKRLEDGIFGFSVESGEPIPAERLETIPWGRAHR